MKNNLYTFDHSSFMSEKLSVPKDSFWKKILRRLQHLKLIFDYGWNVPKTQLRNLYKTELEINQLLMLRQQRRVMNLITIHVAICFKHDLCPSRSKTGGVILDLLDDVQNRQTDRRDMLMITRFPYREVASMMLACGDISTEMIESAFGDGGKSNPVDRLYRWLSDQDVVFEEAQSIVEEEPEETIPATY